MRNRAHILNNRSGMTLLEMILALAVFTIVVGSSLNFVRSQSRGFRLGTERMDQLQNLRFSANILEQDLRTAGSNVPDEQPYIVYAGPDVIAFNADYTTNVRNDAWAVYFDPDAPTGSVSALERSGKITIPHSSFGYPDTSYKALGGITNSPAETIIFFFDLDSSTARPDDYALYRQVNRDPPELVARDLLKTPGLPFLDYFRVRKPLSAPLLIEQVPQTDLPLSHAVPVHGSTADTAAVARIDSLRGVQINFTTTNGRTGAAERQRSISRLVRLPNAGLAVKRSCGDEPILGITLTAQGVTLSGGDPAVNLSWGQAVDETGGENDVTRYVLWRRPDGQPNWGDPFLSIPSGQSSYTYQDLTVQSGERWYYALAAQDCTPTLSQIASSQRVDVP
ncbi:MAG: prepilin-type N-terminal cleavage/methylation domain-containing protein [Gemmatimonadales bacterium]